MSNNDHVDESKRAMKREKRKRGSNIHKSKERSIINNFQSSVFTYRSNRRYSGEVIPYIEESNMHI